VKLIVGLGNPGRKYHQTRHNLGFRVVEDIAEQNSVTINKRLCDSLVGELMIMGERVLLAKPQTYMNRSGNAVKSLLREFRGSPEDLVVIYDELDLPFGRIRVRLKGSAAGHRGAMSIMESLAGAPFYRVRVGIGRPPEGLEAADFVLKSFLPDEVEQLDEIISRAAKAALCIFQEDGQRAMEKFNRFN
jgi:peptidyl-tRNA hydrolase, PTH1 family